MLAGGVVPVYHDAEMTFGIGAGHMADFAILRRKMVDNQLRTSNVTDRRVLAATVSYTHLTLPTSDLV